MDIYAENGTKVKHVRPALGSLWEVDRAKRNLIIGNEYTVDYTEVLQSGNRVYLQEFPKIPFLSSHFKDSN